jgi:valyl-tRNA synthetase
MALDEKFLKPYDPKGTEDKIYNIWEESGFFNPDICIEKKVCSPDAEAFSIILPPPNATGTLHLGHAVMLSIEDIMVRFARMQGKRTLWVPGTDHAALATHTKVEKELYKKESKTRHDLGREEFIKRIEDFVEDSRGTITNQVRKMGASIDWSREAFTLDKKREVAVNTAFKDMYDDGLIYQGERIINWDPYGQTTVSDDEVERVERQTPFYYFKYGPFEIATARPETKFGDKYVVMHPDDNRYAEYEDGQKIELEWINGPIEATVIKDEAIDMEFGTGVMTITPAHSAIDYDIAKKRDLDIEQIIGLDGKLLDIAGDLAGQHIKKARPMVVERLREKGLLVKTDENYNHSAAINSRGGGVIEPQILKQWFIDVNKEFQMKDSKIEGIKTGDTVTLKRLMKHVVEKEQIEIMPDRFEKVYYHWIDNLRDWNISRQIWYGHQIPAWYHENKCIPKKDGSSDFDKCKNIVISGEKPTCEYCDAEYVRDPDTLDTWFSSGLWTFSTLGWPEETSDLKTYHPTNVMETGYDIIFFWVARMILMSTYHMGEIPFEKVYLHGLVLNKHGKKMSKSSGDTTDPLEMIEKFGADALRMAMIVGVGPGSDNSLSEDKIRAYKKFSNKVWNASRFVLENTENLDLIDRPKLSESDESRMKELDEIVKDVTDDMENHRLYLAAEKLYHYFWHTFADVVIEESKSRLLDGSDDEKKAAGWTLLHILKTTLKMLHPFIPFITEEIWSSMREDPSRRGGAEAESLLMVSKWPHTS